MTDRWLEMDIDWFNPDSPLQPQIAEWRDRIKPLYDPVDGWRGLVFNIGWLIDLVTEWTGSPDQLLPLRSRRSAKWAAHSYGDLAQFIAELRRYSGLPDLKIGILFVGWAHVVWPPELKIYDFDSAWYNRHPELYDPPKSFIGMPDMHPIKRLHADTYPYAAFPGGLAEGAYFPDVFAAQWAHLAAFLDLDLLHLRDGLTGPMIYTRNGPYGTRAPADPALVEAFSQSVRDLYRAIKTAAPQRLVFGYSSAISPIADWRVGCVDFEALVADGFIDGWIEQTWGGAWQDWWHQLWKGWTFQAANLLTRGAMIAAANTRRETPCRFYNLIETWDGWEPWDTIHQVPEKLRWAMWAFTHMSVAAPDGIKPPDGSYISWLNNGERKLLSASDIAFVNNHLTAAQRDARSMSQNFGWSLVYNRAAIEWLSHEHPDWNAGEWLDDQAALLMKWGVPISAITRAEWLDDLPDSLRASGLIASLPDPQLGGAQRMFRQPALLIIGRADLLTSSTLDALGLTRQNEAPLISGGFHRITGREVPAYERPYLPEHAPISAAVGTETLMATEAGIPILSHRSSLGLSTAYWQPPDWSEPFNQFLPKYQLGSTFPHYRVARLLHEMARNTGICHLENIAWSQPCAFHLWRSANGIHMLLGNLETGELGDSRTPRAVRVCLSRDELGLGAETAKLVDADQQDTLDPVLSDERWLRFDVNVPPQGMRRLILRS